MATIAARIAEAQKTAVLPIRALSEVDWPELEDMKGELTKITAELDILDIVTPVNAAGVKAEWLELARGGYFTNPQYEYDLDKADSATKATPALIKLKHMAEDIYIDQSLSATRRLLLALLIDRIDSALGTTLMAQGILQGDDETTLRGSTLKWYRFPAWRTGIGWCELVERAREGVEDIAKQNKLLDTPQISAEQLAKLKAMTLEAHEIADYFRDVVSDVYKFDYDVVVDKRATSISVRHSNNPRIVIPQDRQMNGLKLVQLVRHEIDCHLRDNHNSAELLCGLGGRYLHADEDVVSEGHAVTEEYAMQRHCTGTSNIQALPWLVLAEYAASQGASFAEVATEIHELRKYAAGGKESDGMLANTYATVYRAMRGATNTENPYGYVFYKDKAYLQGTLEVTELQAAGLGHWAELGGVELDELVRIARVCRFEPEDLPYADQRGAYRVLEQITA